MGHSFKAIHVLQFGFGLCLLILVMGCNPASSSAEAESGHGHSHEHVLDLISRPETLRESIIELNELAEGFFTAMEQGNTQDAHDPLHRIGLLLEVMPELAADTDLAEEEWTQVKQEAEKLFEAFSKVDSTFHENGADSKKAFENVKPTIDESLIALIEKLPSLESETATSLYQGSVKRDNEDEKNQSETEE